MKELHLELEKLEPRVAPGLIGVITIPTLVCPPPPDTCPPPPPDDCTSDTSGGNNGYGNGGQDGVPGSSADNNAPNADEKAADQVR